MARHRDDRRISLGYAFDGVIVGVEHQGVIADDPHVLIAEDQDVLVVGVELEVEQAGQARSVILDRANVQRAWPVRYAARVVDDAVAGLTKRDLIHGRVNTTIQ